MADAVQPDSTTVQQLLKRSRSLWSSYVAATTDLRLPAEYRLKLITNCLLSDTTIHASAYESAVYQHGVPRWESATFHPKRCARSSSMDSTIRLAALSPNNPTLWTGLVFKRETDKKVEGNHLAILLLAWAYVLSARWVELQPSCGLTGSLPPGAMHYSDLQAARLNNEEDIPADTIETDIGEECERAARWWAAILAPGEGWYATVDFGDKIYRSPWSAHIASVAHQSWMRSTNEAAFTRR
ncbi:MAG: hypothetical protein Q9176_006883 [Flavoplaca citrina]